MKNKYNISDNIKKLMQEVENPKRPPKGWEGVMEYDWQHYNELLNEVFSDMKEMASEYGIVLDEAWFRNHIEHLSISVQDYSEQKTFLKELVLLGCKIWTDYDWKVKGHSVENKIIQNRIRKSLSDGLMGELVDFVKKEREKNIYVDCILIDKIKNCLHGKEVDYPQNYYKKGIEDYLCSSIDFSCLEYDRCTAAHSLAYCVLGKNYKQGWKPSIKELAFIYDLLFYCGFVSKEQKYDKELEIYPEKHKYDVIKEYFGVGGKSNKK